MRTKYLYYSQYMEKLSVWFVYLIGEIRLPPMNKRAKLHKKKKEYSENFTIHGLSRVFHGTRLEQIFWFLAVGS